MLCDVNFNSVIFVFFNMDVEVFIEDVEFMFEDVDMLEVFNVVILG